jgi:hypothetical protein
VSDFSNWSYSQNIIELINDEAAYHETLRYFGVAITANLKSVDFNNKTIVNVVIGQKYSSGFISLSLKDVGEGDGFYGYSLEVELAFPGKNCPADGLLTQPYLLVVIPKTQKDICLRVDESIIDCELSIRRDHPKPGANKIEHL